MCAGVSPANYAAVQSWPIRLVDVLSEPPSPPKVPSLAGFKSGLVLNEAGRSVWITTGRFSIIFTAVFSGIDRPSDGMFALSTSPRFNCD